jgi:hypothetical protein
VPVRLLPDAELVMITWLAGQPDVLALLGSADRVGSYRPGDRPYIQVNRVGGAPDIEEDHPLLQVSVWHTSDDAASELARTIVAALPDILSANVRGQNVTLGPFSQPDEDNQRYILTVELLTYPEE